MEPGGTERVGMAVGRIRTGLAVLALTFSSPVLAGCTSDSRGAGTDADTGGANPTTSAASATPVPSTLVPTLMPTTLMPATGNDQLAGGSAFVVRATGIDDVRFGDDLQAARETLLERHGEPDDDSGWLDQQAPCEGLGTKVRTLTWGNVVLEFSNGPTEFGPADSEHLIAYFSADESDSTVVLAPDNLPLLDRTVAELRTRFPGATFSRNEISGPEYHLPGGVDGALTGLADTDTSQTFRAGLICID